MPCVLSSPDRVPQRERDPASRPHTVPRVWLQNHVQEEDEEEYPDSLASITTLKLWAEQAEVREGDPGCVTGPVYVVFPSVLG